MEASITALAAQGLSYGIHVVVSASRWAEIRPALKDQIGTRIELRLGDPAESEMDRKRARQLVQSPPGRGITRDGRELVIAVPRFDAATADQAADAICGARRAARSSCYRRGSAHDELIAAVTRACAPRHRFSWVSVRPNYGPIAVDFAAEAHLIVLGQGECGKTATLRTLCREIVRTNTAESAQLFIVDFRRGLLGVVESDHLAAYTPSAAALTSQLSALVERLQARMPGADVSQQQLRTRSWWSGPEIYVVIDDYDLVAAPNGNQSTRAAARLSAARQGSRFACRGGAALRRCRARDVRSRPGSAARPRVHGPDDERQPGRGRPARYRSAVATATGPGNARHPRSPGTADPDRLERTGVKESVVEVGPGAVRGPCRRGTASGVDGAGVHRR